MLKEVELINRGMYYVDGELVDEQRAIQLGMSESMKAQASKRTIAYSILSKHNTTAKISKDSLLKIKFDALASHDITYVGIIQTAKASGLEKFPIPYVLTNCHNSLCAVGGTINEDDHMFGLSAAKKYGGIYVPPHLAVIHTYMREKMSGCGKMILGSDSHTRYGALGTMAIGEGGPELVKQLLERTYDIKYPNVVAVYLQGNVKHGIGPHDVSLSIIKEVFPNGFVKNCVLEFIGPGIGDLPIEFRNGIDVMTTETTCLTSIWQTDLTTRDYFRVHGRVEDYKELKPKNFAYYDKVVMVDLSKITAKIAMPFHPAHVYALKDVINNPYDVLKQVEEKNAYINNNNIKFSLLDKIENGKLRVEQGIIAGCSGGTYDNIYIASEILKNQATGSDVFSLSVYPSSQPIYVDLVKKGCAENLMLAGAVMKTAFCGPCFGAGDVPSNNGLSIRHTTRNFESREGSKPNNGQIASVALMDARSIAATALNQGFLTSAEDIDYDDRISKFQYNDSIYENRVYNGWGKKDSNAELKYGPNIKDWPEQIELTDNLIIKLASVIKDPVTTTDELIPSGETSSYRSNPLKLAEFALSRKDPKYVERAKAIHEIELDRRKNVQYDEITRAIKAVKFNLKGTTSIGSCVYAVKPGDGSAREQAASSQRVLGGVCNIAKEYATKRYRSNLINWGMLPFISLEDDYQIDDIIIIPNIRKKLLKGDILIEATLVRGGLVKKLSLSVEELSKEERDIIASGCLINYYKLNKQSK